MYINNCPQITFGAKFIKDTSIDKFDDKTRKYIPQKAAILEFEPEKDLKELDFGVHNYWGYSFLSDEILDNAEKLANGTKDSRNHKIYILTEQDGNFEKLEPEKITGLAKIERVRPENVYLDLFQVRPDTAYSKKTNCTARKIKHAGEAIINLLKEKYSSINLVSTYNAANFYEKMGFEIIDVEKMFYLWRRK